MQQIDVFTRLAVDASGRLYLYEGEDQSFGEGLHVSFSIHFLRWYSDTEKYHGKSKRTLKVILDSEDRTKVWIVLFSGHLPNLENPTQHVLSSKVVRLHDWLAEAGLELISLEQKKYGAYQQPDQA